MLGAHTDAIRQISHLHQRQCYFMVHDLPLIFLYDLPLIASYDLPQISLYDLPLIATYALPLISLYDLPLIATYDLPLIAMYDLPLIATYDLPLIALNDLPLIASCRPLSRATLGRHMCIEHVRLRFSLTPAARHFDDARHAMRAPALSSTVLEEFASWGARTRARAQ